MGSFQILNFQIVSIWHKIRDTLPSSPSINTIGQTLLCSESQRTSSHCCSLTAVSQHSAAGSFTKSTPQIQNGWPCNPFLKKIIKLWRHEKDIGFLAAETTSVPCVAYIFSVSPGKSIILGSLTLRGIISNLIFLAMILNIRAFLLFISLGSVNILEKKFFHQSCFWHAGQFADISPFSEFSVT